MQKIFYTKKELEKIVDVLLKKIPVPSTISFWGDMGSGKTTMIKEMIKRIGGLEAGNSPSFGIVNEYTYPDGEVLGYHFDFFRLNKAEEALDLGLEDYLDQDVWIFIEWPEIVEELLPDDLVNISLKIIDPETRELSLEVT